MFTKTDIPPQHELEYIVSSEERPIIAITNKFLCDDATALRWLEHYKILKPDIQNKHPDFYILCDRKYCHLFDEACKERIRDKYDRKCFLCGT